MTSPRFTRRPWPYLAVTLAAFTLWAATYTRRVMDALDEYERRRG